MTYVRNHTHSRQCLPSSAFFPVESAHLKKIAECPYRGGGTGSEALTLQVSHCNRAGLPEIVG